MTDGYRPIFNRKYLTALIWFCLIAIVVLTSMGPESTEPGKINRLSERNIYWLEQPEAPLTLTLTFATPPALHPKQTLLHKLMLEIMRQRLQPFTHPDFSYGLSQQLDGLALTLSWLPEQSAPPLTAMLTALRKPVDPLRWASALETLKAEAYLDNQTTESQLLQQFLGQFPAPSIPLLEMLVPSYADSMNSPAISLSGDGAEQASQQLPPLSIVSTKRSDIDRFTPAAQITGSPKDENFHLLLGSSLPGRQADTYLMQRWVIQTLQDLLANYHQQQQLDYRLLFRAGGEAGYRAILLHSQQHPAKILQQLQAAATEQQLESSRAGLITQWQEDARQPLTRHLQLTQLSRYQFPPDQLEQDIDQLKSLDVQLAIAGVKAALQSRAQFSILLPPH
ncbi:hypothetical protein ACFVYJ_06135 [Pontibacter sp. JAM-7]|uniref:hypothetical protein n=1 Tax=Pontibacter sp. JAM-7 TaxID=3366581 RepID=UPI003AF5FF68